MQTPETCPKCGTTDCRAIIFAGVLVSDSRCNERQIARLTAELASVKGVARKAIDAARHYPLWSWTDVEAELEECEKQLESILHPTP